MYVHINAFMVTILLTSLLFFIAMYQPVDVVYTRKTRRESPQVTSYPHNDTETSPTDPLGEEFSQQLSEEGFTPAAVKSKKSSPTTAKTTK